MGGRKDGHGRKLRLQGRSRRKRASPHHQVAKEAFFVRRRWLTSSHPSQKRYDRGKGKKKEQEGVGLEEKGRLQRDQVELCVCVEATEPLMMAEERRRL